MSDECVKKPGLLHYAGMAVLAGIVAYAFHTAPVPSDVTSAAIAASSSTPVIYTRGAYAYQLDKVLVDQNGDAQLPLASLAKIMTVYTGATILSSNTEITIPEKAISNTDTIQLKVGERWRFDELARLTLVSSSNTGAAAICNELGKYIPEENAAAGYDANIARCLSEMNLNAKRLGLKTMYFLNPTGLDANSEIGGAYGSPRDMAVLLLTARNKFQNLYDPTGYDKIKVYALSGEEYDVNNTNTNLQIVPHTIASKTGTTKLTGGNLAVISLVNNEPTTLVVMGSTEEERHADLKSLYNYALSALGLKND